MKKQNKIILTAILIVSASLFALAYSTFLKINTKEQASIYISTGSSNEQILCLVSEKLQNKQSFKRAFNMLFRLSSSTNIRAGKFTIEKGANNIEILRVLLGGKRQELKVNFNNIVTLEELASTVSKQIEADSASIMECIYDKSFLEETGLNSENIKVIFLPDTYNFFWDSSAEVFVDKIFTEYKNFWNNNRLEKAQKLGLSPAEVTTLASIVEKESPKDDEQAIIAGLYLNRLKKGIRLQADPTVIYALRKEGRPYNVRRVLFEDLKIDSPYNTYKISGLPPAPINIVQKRSIDAVLNAEKHSYIYMCVDAERIGYHSFASSFSEHEKNKKKYVAWLKKNNIKR